MSRIMLFVFITLFSIFRSNDGASVQDNSINCQNELTNSLCKEPSTLKFVYAFFRHGIRSPLYKPYPTDPNKSKYHTYFPGKPGQLTEVGKQQMYEVGKRLKLWYGNYFGEYADGKIYTSSTNLSRTIQSALSTMAGQFPPSKPIFGELRWQPVPIFQYTEIFDKANLYNDPNFPELSLIECPVYGALIKRGYDKITNPDATEGRQKMYELLQHYTGEANFNSVNDLYELYDTLQFESLNGLPLPGWATEQQPYYQGRPLYPDIMDPVMVEWFRDTEYLDDDKDMLLFYSGPLFNSIHEYFSNKADKPHTHEKIRYQSTHDTTLFAILWALGLQKPLTVGPGDGILFELHEQNHAFTVKVFYYDATHGHRIKELSLPQCPCPCSLDQFIQATPGLTPQQWHQKCFNNNQLK